MEIAPEFLIDPDSLTAVDMQNVTGGYSEVSFCKSPQFPFVLAKKRILGKGTSHNVLESEFLIPQKLIYPTILRPLGIVDIVKNGNQIEVLSEFIPNGTAWQMIEKEKAKAAPPQWNSTTKSKIFYGIVKAIDFMNQMHYMHLDLKADNVILDENYEPYLMDFSLLCKQTEGRQIINGNPRYQAPEAKNGIYTVKSDWYGLGILRYQLETLNNPYVDLPTQTTLWFAKEAGKRMSKDSSALTTELLNSNPNKRPSPEEVANFLEAHIFLFGNETVDSNNKTDVEEFDNYVHRLRLREQYEFAKLTPEQRIEFANIGIATAQYLAFHDTGKIEYLVCAANQNSILAKTELKELLMKGEIVARDIETALSIPSFATNEATITILTSYESENIAGIYRTASEVNDAYLFSQYFPMNPIKGDGLALFLGANCMQEYCAFDVQEAARRYMMSLQCGYIDAAGKLVEMMTKNYIELDVEFIKAAAALKCPQALLWMMENGDKGKYFAIDHDSMVLVAKDIYDVYGPQSTRLFSEYFYTSGQPIDCCKILFSSENRSPYEDYILGCALQDGVGVAADYLESVRNTVISAYRGCEAAMETIILDSPSELIDFWKKEEKDFKGFFSLMAAIRARF